MGVGTPRDILVKINADVNRILASEEVRKNFQAQGSEPMIMNLDQLAEYVRAETAKWALAVKASGAKAD